MAPEDTPTVVYEVAPAVVRSVDRPPMAACGLNLETPAMLAHALDTKTPAMPGIETTRVAEVAQGGASHGGTPEVQLVRRFTVREIADAVEVILGDPAEEVRLEQKIATIKRKYTARHIEEPNPDIAEAHCRTLCRSYGAVFVEALESSFDNLEDAEIAAIFGEKKEEPTDNGALMFYVAPMGGNMSKVSRIVYFDRTAPEKGFKRAVLKEIKSKDIEKYKTDTSRGQEVFPEDEENEEDDDETEIVSVPVSAVHALTILKEKATAEKLRVFQQQGRFKKFPELIDAHSSALIYEWKDAVDLETKLETLNTNDALECQEFWLQFADILEAIDELHQLDPTLIHGDLKPGNMGMSKKGQPLSVAIFDIGSVEGKEEVDGTQYTLGSMKDTPFSEIDAYEERNRVELIYGRRPIICTIEKPITDYYYSFATTWHAQNGNIPLRRIDYFAIGRTIEKLAFGNIDPKEEDKTIPFKDPEALRPICDGLMRYKKSDGLYQHTENLGLSGIARFIRQVYQ